MKLSIPLILLTLSACTGHYEYVSHDPASPYYRPRALVVERVDYTIPRYKTICVDRAGHYVPMGQVDRQRGDRCVLDRVN